MAASKDRLRWNDLTASVRTQIQQLVDGTVVKAQNCPGGFSPGFASRLSLSYGRRVFVKAMDIDTWPEQAIPYRAEAHTTAALPTTVAAPRLLGMLDDGHWVVLAFEDVDGGEPQQPWNSVDLDRVGSAMRELSLAVTPSPVVLPRTHPRLGGWAELAGNPISLARLTTHSPWAVDHVDLLISLEESGLAAAQGDTLVHFDLYPHNIMLTPERVLFVDWPHARLGAQFIDLVLVPSSAAASGIDPEPILCQHTDTVEPTSIDAVLAAHAGFGLAGGLYPAPQEFQPIADYKVYIGLATVEWLRRRLASRA